MAYSTINKGSSFMNPILYTGTGSNQSITGVGFQPDLIWGKSRNVTGDNYIFDAVRGSSNLLKANSNAEEETGATTALTGFDSDGFSVGTSADMNGSTNTRVAWNWKAGTTSGLSGGTITPSSYSINTTSGFGIYKWTGTGSAGTIAHGLGATPKMMIVKALSGAPGGAQAWSVYHASLGNDKFLVLNSTDAETTTTTDWNSTSPTDTLFTLGTANRTNAVGGDYIGYVFADVTGFSKFGIYSGNGDVDGPMIYTGFRPAWLMVKRKNSTSNWTIVDTTRAPSNVISIYSDANLSTTDGSYAGWDIVSNGFKFRNTDAGINASGGTYIYMAFGQPIISNSGVPANAR